MSEEYDCGYAVPTDDPQAFAGALIDAADHLEDLKETGKRARALAERDFDRAKLAKEWVDWVTGENEIANHQ